jgi:ABC-type nitrate/sulfonate/bicarbonate transport system substrate-binding protein
MQDRFLILTNHGVTLGTGGREGIVMRHTVLFPLAAALALIGVAFALLAQTHAASPMTRVNVQLGWIKNTEFAGLFVADRKGFYAQENLEVNFISGGAGIDPLSIVRSNPEFIGVVSSSGTLVNAVSRGAPYMALAAFYQKHPNGFLLLADSPIQTYKDFEGKRIGVQPEGEFYLDVLAAIHSLDKSKIQIIRVGFDPTPLLTGQIDAYMSWVVNQPYALEKAGKKWRFMLLADNPGVQFYAMLPFTTQQNYGRNRSVIERWLRASLRGWSYVLDNSNEAAELTVRYYLPGGDLDAEKWLLSQANPITISEDTKRYGLGWMDPQRWEAGIQTLLRYKQIERAPGVADIMTNSLVERIAIKR